MRPPKVYIIEQPTGRINVDTAKTYGEMCVIFDRDVRRPSAFKPTEYCEAVITELVAREFSPEIDFVCVAGALLPNCLLVAAITARWGHINLLMFDAHRETYVDKELVLTASAA